MYLHKRTLIGMQADRAQALDGAAAALWRVWPNQGIDPLQGLRPGVQISRNRDHAWEALLNRKSAQRRIGVRAHFAETAAGYTLTLEDEDGIAATATLAIDKQAAQQPETAEPALREQIGRLGNTDFELRGLTVQWMEPRFVPASAANRLRREAVERLEAARSAAYERPLRQPASEPPAVYPERALSYLANVYNQAARRFYARHGVELIDAAYEAHEESGEVPLMITKHCLRWSFSLCPKQAKGITGVQGQVRAEPMTLVNGSERLTLRFDCKACEMHVVGRIRPHVLASPPPASVPVAPVRFHRRQPG